MVSARPSAIVGFVFLIALTAPSCAPAPTDAPGARVALSVAPLSYPGVTNATYTLEVRNKSGQTVFTRALDSRGYGDGNGSLSYVGPCDADPSENPNTVSLTLTGLYGGSDGTAEIPPSSYHNPGTLSRTATCDENADTPVTFDLTLARAANQGFFDVAIAFENIFCSAKLDCVDDQGETLRLLHAADSTRGRSVVLGLACTGDVTVGGETHLYRNPIAVTCTGGTATVDPTAGPGNVLEGQGLTSTGTAPLFAAAIYRGQEQLGFNKSYWNVVLGLHDTAASCRVTTTATASPEPFADDQTPAGTTWPYIVWDVALTDAASARACTTHPIDGAAPHDGVYTDYTDVDAPEPFGATYYAGAPDLGQDLGHAATSCLTIAVAAPDSPTGLYWLDFGAGPEQVYCDMPSGTPLRLGASVGASWTAISAGCPAGWEPYAIDRFARVAIAEAFVATQSTPDWYWLNFFAGPDTAVTGALENQLGWISSTSPLVWTASGFADSGATALPNLDISGNQNQGFHDPIPLSRTLGFANRGGGTNYIYNSAEQSFPGPVVCTRTNAVAGALTLASPGRWADGAIGAACDAYRHPAGNLVAATSDGVYLIDPDGADTGVAPFAAYCDMTTDGGGWTLVGSQVTTQQIDAITADDIWPENEADPSASFRLGNARLALLAPHVAWRLTSHNATTAALVDTGFTSPSCVIDWLRLVGPAAGCGTLPANVTVPASYDLVCGRLYTTTALATALSGYNASSNCALGIGQNNSMSYCSLRLANVSALGAAVAGSALPCTGAEIGTRDIRLWAR